MGLLDLSSFKVTNNVSNVDATTQDSTLDAIQAVVNALVDANIDPAAAITISKLADPTTGKFVGSSGGAAAAVFPPGHKYSRTEFTSPVSVTATSEGAATTIVTAAAVTFDGATDVNVEFFSPDAFCAGNAAGNKITLVLYEDGASIGIFGVLREDQANDPIASALKLERQLTPASGSRTYSVRAYRSNADCTVGAGVGGSGAEVPGFIRIVKA